MQTVSYTVKHADSTKRGKNCSRYEARENVQPMPSAVSLQSLRSVGKHVTGGRAIGVASPCLIKQHVSFDWLP